MLSRDVAKGFRITDLCVSMTDKGNLFPIQKLESPPFLFFFAFSIVFYFKSVLIGPVVLSIYAIAKIAFRFSLRYAHLYHVITATQVMCVVISCNSFYFLKQKTSKNNKTLFR